MDRKKALFEHVAERIRELRTSYGGSPGISQDLLAKELQVAANTISRWETGTYRPTLEDLDRLARFFGVSILEFFPADDMPEGESLNALLRAAKQLDKRDLEELRKYAEYRRARHLHGGGVRPRPGRKRKRDS